MEASSSNVLHDLQLGIWHHSDCARGLPLTLTQTRWTMSSCLIYPVSEMGDRTTCEPLQRCHMVFKSLHFVPRKSLKCFRKLLSFRPSVCWHAKDEQIQLYCFSKVRQAEHFQAQDQLQCRDYHDRFYHHVHELLSVQLERQKIGPP